MVKRTRKILAWIIQCFWNLKLRTKLIITYIPLIILSFFVVGVIFYDTSTDIIINSSSSNIYTLVKKSNEIIDKEFELIQNGVMYLHIDSDLYDSFQGMDEKNHFDILSKDRVITQALYKYIPKTENIYSVNLVTRYFTFGRNAMIYIPKLGFSSSFLYEEGKKAQYKTRWIPSFDFHQLLEPYEGSMPRWKRHYTFSAVKRVNPSVSLNGRLYNMDYGKEQPVLVINFKEDMLYRAFENNISIPGSYYLVTTQDNRIVSHPDMNQIGTTLREKWLNEIVAQKSGKKLTRIGGQKMLVCFDTSGVTGWTAVIVIPYDKLLSSLPTVRYLIIYIGACFILLSLVLAYIISVKITNPVNKLVHAIKKVGQGKFNVRLDVASRDEIGYLTQKFNEMNENILKLIEENYDSKLKQKEAQIKALKLQFNPHFLYNTLNVINYKALDQGNRDVSKMIVSLSGMLKYTVQDFADQVPFEEDMRYLKNYIYIMSERLEGKFRVEYHLEEALYQYTVPKFFLQPFVENAIIHGFEDMEKDGVLTISGWVDENTRYYSIRDNGKGFDADSFGNGKDSLKNIGIGISNIDSQIKLLYGEEYGITLHSSPQNGTEVIIAMGKELKRQ